MRRLLNGLRRTETMALGPPKIGHEVTHFRKARCPGCGRRYRATGWMGDVIRCPACKAWIERR